MANSEETRSRPGNDSAKPAAPAGAQRPLGGVWAVVVTWNGREVIGPCLESLRPAMARGCHVVVVDNASTDGTPAAVEAGFPGVELLPQATNLGFGGGNNVGIRRALAQGASHVLFLNQDATLAPDAVDELLAASERHPEAGTVSAKIYFQDRPGTLWFAGATFSVRTGRTRDIGSGEVDRGQYDRESPIQRGTACAMLVTRRYLESVGFFDEALFLYGEEMNLTLRARGSGLVNYFAPRARAWHRVSSSTGGAASGEYLYYHTRNTLHLIHRHAPLRSRSLSVARDALVLLVMLGSIVTMRTLPLSSVRAVLAGAKDFARRRMGERLVAASRAVVTRSA